MRFGSTSGRFGRLRTIRRSGPFRIGGASLAANPRGDAALAWWEDRGTRTDRVYVALRRAGHGFGAAAAPGHGPDPRRGGGDRRARRRARELGRPRRAAHALRAARAALVPRHGHDPLQARLLRRHAPGRHPVRPRGAGVELPVRLGGRRPRRPSATRPRPAGREHGASTARGCSRRSRPRPPTGSAARSTRSSTRPAWSRSPGVAPPACASGAARRPRRRCRRQARPPCSPTSRRARRPPARRLGRRGR